MQDSPESTSPGVASQTNLVLFTLWGDGMIMSNKTWLSFRFELPFHYTIAVFLKANHVHRNIKPKIIMITTPRLILEVAGVVDPAEPVLLSTCIPNSPLG
ncbi:hypothetical protein DL546_005359 [Coniochaeta pulveracea]|uniref:Uncharacterized protein n=1 Tax=Coniochaeta pulveracea TaxID=177199 RepID=A0A420Y8Q3_9PEZI|nr:hypothetical protein DL546_005359 [Coniochaeta pulveracea]